MKDEQEIAENAEGEDLTEGSEGRKATMGQSALAVNPCHEPFNASEASLEGRPLATSY